MSIRRHNARRDGNEPAIIAELERLGAWVYRIDLPTDLLVWYRGGLHLFEVKAARGKLNPTQVRFIDAYPGRVWVVRSETDVRIALRQLDDGEKQ